MKYTMFKNKDRGFTLIELLIVIAIIGILAAMILANLQSARWKAQDAAMIGTLSAARAEAAIWYDDNFSYPGMCTVVSYSPNGVVNATRVDRLMQGAANEGRQAVSCQRTVTSFTAYAPLNYISTGATPLTTFCIDSTGFSGKITAAQASAGIVSNGTSCLP